MNTSPSLFRRALLLATFPLCIAPWANAAEPPSGVTFSLNGAKPASANDAIMAYLGEPVAPPANLDAKYTPEGLMAAFRTACRKQGLEVRQLAVDQTEFPFLVYGIIEGQQAFQKLKEGFQGMNGYTYGGSTTGSLEQGVTYFALNMMPHTAYPRNLAEPIRRRLMVRLQMLGAIWNDR